MNEKKIRHGHPRFYEIIEELKDLHSRKNAQYATGDNPLGNFKRCADLSGKLFNPTIKNKPLAMALQLMVKQIDGVYEMVGESKKDTPDGLDDKLRDIAVYAIICLVLLEE